MPIPQSRLIDLATHGEVLMDTLDNLREWTKGQNITEAIEKANSVADQSPDPTARSMAKELAALLGTIYYTLATLEVPLSIRKNIMEETIHFAKHKKSNEWLAAYQRTKKRAQTEMRESQSRFPQFFSDNISPPTLAISPEPKPRTKDTSEDYNKVDPNNIFPPGTEPTPLTGKGYEGTTATSVPTLAELNEVPIPKPGEGNVL